MTEQLAVPVALASARSAAENSRAGKILVRVISAPRTDASEPTDKHFLSPPRETASSLRKLTRQRGPPPDSNG